MLLAFLPAYLYLGQFKSHLLSIAKKKKLFSLYFIKSCELLGMTSVSYFITHDMVISHIHILWEALRGTSIPLLQHRTEFWTLVCMQLFSSSRFVFTWWTSGNICRNLFIVATLRSSLSFPVDLGVLLSHEESAAGERSWNALWWDCFWMSH